MLVAVISFTVAVVITALCIKFRKREQKSQDVEDHVLKKGKVESMRKKLLAGILALALCSTNMPPPDHICGGIYFRKSGCSV